MNHRAGFINGEGDGVGIHIDIPRKLWKEKLEQAGSNPEEAEKDNFVVGHIFIKRTDNVAEIKGFDFEQTGTITIHYSISFG